MKIGCQVETILGRLTRIFRNCSLFPGNEMILANKSILLLDEDPEVLIFLTGVFEERGVRVLRSRSRAEAMEMLGRKYVPVDLIVANIVITHLSETDFEYDVASLRPGIPILYMSAFAEGEVLRVEMMKRPYSLSVGSEMRSSSTSCRVSEGDGVVDAVMSALVKGKARAGAG